MLRDEVCFSVIACSLLNLHRSDGEDASVAGGAEGETEEEREKRRAAEDESRNKERSEREDIFKRITTIEQLVHALGEQASEYRQGIYIDEKDREEPMYPPNYPEPCQPNELVCLVPV